MSIDRSTDKQPNLDDPEIKKRQQIGRFAKAKRTNTNKQTKKTTHAEMQ